jgi:hypothetical protein
MGIWSSKSEVDIRSAREDWQIRDRNFFEIKVEGKTEDLIAAQQTNRELLEPLRKQYAAAVHKDGGIEKKASRERRALYEELHRRFRAMEAIKNELARRGVDYEHHPSDQEHPNAAYRRLFPRMVFEPRHYLAVLSAVMFALSPIVWLLSETWAPAAIWFGIAMVMGSAAVRLVPAMPPENVEA